MIWHKRLEWGYIFNMDKKPMTQFEMGRKGGLKRAAQTTPEERHAIAEKGGEAMKEKTKNDPDYYKRISALATQARLRNKALRDAAKKQKEEQQQQKAQEESLPVKKTPGLFSFLRGNKS